MPVTRLTDDGDPPKPADLRRRLGFVRRRLERGSLIVFVHPYNPAQAPAFGVLERTYAPYLRVKTACSRPGHRLSGR